MKIKWFGHSCFLITSEKGIKIVTDPFDEEVGYDLPDAYANIISISHDHHDHNNVGILKGAPVLVKGSGKINVKGIEVTGVETFHDDVGGKKRGLNTIFKFEVDGLNVCHLGDLGHALSLGQVKEIGKVDILLTPVGGIYTIDNLGAFKVMDILKPAVTIPMHYKTEALSFELLGVEDFLSVAGDYKKIDGSEIEIKKDCIDEYPKIIVLDYN